jgi:hypothetical protein
MIQPLWAREYSATYMSHDYKIGRYVRQGPGDKFEIRTDVCRQCKCERHIMMMDNKGDAHYHQVFAYKRAGAVFGRHNEPGCWGGPEPK